MRHRIQLVVMLALATGCALTAGCAMPVDWPLDTVDEALSLRREAVDAQCVLFVQDRTQQLRQRMDADGLEWMSETVQEPHANDDVRLEMLTRGGIAAELTAMMR